MEIASIFKTNVKGQRMKKLAFSALLAVCSCVQADEIPDAVVTSVAEQITWTRFDGSICFFCPKTIKQGRHTIELGKFGSRTCDIIGGHNYSIEAAGCVDKGRRMDFPGAQEYWANLDAAERIKNEEAAKNERQAKTQAEEAKYQSDKIALVNAKSKADLEAIIQSVDWKLRHGVNQTDPDNLLPQAREKLAPYLADERKQQEQEAARLAKAEASQKESERLRIASFHKHLEEGSETSCGLVIEKKAKLVKVQLKSTGAEQWLKMEDVLPPTMGCSLGDSTNLKTGQKVCGVVNGITLSKPTDYVVVGQRHVQPNKGKIEITGFVEGSSGKKLQIRISGMTFINTEIDPHRYTGVDAQRGVVLRESVNSLPNYKGSELKVNAIIWDDVSSGWSACN